MDAKIKAAQQAFIERLGLITQASGLPRIAGRLFALMVVQGGPLSFRELAEQLQVSRGSISTNTRLLEQLGVIERTSRPGDRQDYFQIRPRPYAQMIEVSLPRQKRSIEVVDEAIEDLGVEQGVQGRLKELRDFYQVNLEITETLLQRMRAMSDDDPAADQALG